MPEHGPHDADVLVLTFKEGWLSGVAHDLALRVEDFRIDVDPDARKVSARLNAASLRVRFALEDGQEAPGALSSEDRLRIEGLIRDEVLHARAHPEIRFESTHVSPDAGSLAGQLTLHGQSRKVEGTLRLEDGCWLALFELDQPAFGITPYRAMMGTLRVQPRVRVRVRVPK